MNRRDPEFGSRLRQLRREKGWSMRKLAARARVGDRTVFVIEKYGQIPRRHTARKLVVALGFDWSQRHSVFPAID